MTSQTEKASEFEQERQQRVNDMVAAEGPGWSEPFKAGSFGCHELLDRTLVAGDLVEQYVLSHPACVAHQEWYALAEQAVTVLRDLYQRIGAEHLDSKNGGS